MTPQQYNEAKLQTVKFEPAKDYEQLLRQANALYMLVKSLEATKSHLSTTCDQLVRQYALQGQGEIDAHRKTNEMLTDEVERLEGLVAQLEERDRWIPVSERLPYKSGDYQVYNPTSVYQNIYTETFHGDCKWRNSNGFITHWKPLPAPPEDKDNE